jgi:hypothetical protein
MNRSQHRRLSRLEKLAQPAIARVRQLDKDLRTQLESKARIHALNFAAITLYGEPRPDESLREAWSRCWRSSIWQGVPCWTPDSIPSLMSVSLSPFDSLGAASLANHLQTHWMPTLSGADENEKLGPIFANAPPLLIWFTFADWTADFLHIELPDLDAMKNVDRSTADLRCWPCLSAKKFEFRPAKPESKRFDVSPSDAQFFIEMAEAHVPQERMSRLDRKRYQSLQMRCLKFLRESGEKPDSKFLFEGELD